MTFERETQVRKMSQELLNELRTSIKFQMHKIINDDTPTDTQHTNLFVQPHYIRSWTSFNTPDSRETKS